MKRSLRLCLALALTIPSCHPIVAVGVKHLYRKADLPSKQMVKDLRYAPDGADAADRRKLDLYLPTGKDWPVIVFVHGGGWDSGGKNLKIAGADVYANIGRFYAAHGIGVAVINYRLQPNVTWREQVNDVKAATRWVHDHIITFGGSPDDIFLMGHSAGAYLVSFAALDFTPDSPPVRGVIPVSGAGLDLTDQKTYDLGADVRYYEKRFRGNDKSEQWKTDGSPIKRLNENAPPFLILYATGESGPLIRQSHLLKEELDRKNIPAELVGIPGESHSRIVLTLSRKDKKSAPTILAFIDKYK